MNFVLIAELKWIWTVKITNRLIDCNYCGYLNISEKEQSELKTKGETKPHICLRFNKRVFHNANIQNHKSYIYPCVECIAEIKRKECEENV